MESLPNGGWALADSSAPAANECTLGSSVGLFFLQPTDISASLSPPLEAPLHSQRIGVEVSEQSLQALPDLLVRRPIGEGALPQHGVVAQLHRTLPIGIAFLERALKSEERTKLHLVHRNLKVTWCI